MTWRNRSNMEGNLKTAFVIGALVFVILLLFLTYRKPEQIQIHSLDYKESPAERNRIERRIKYHGINGVVVLRYSTRGWEFERDGAWCKL